MSTVNFRSKSSPDSVRIVRTLIGSCLLLAAFAVAPVSLAADDDLDPTFDIGTGFDARVDALAVQLDGKIVAGGAFASFNGVARSRVARLNSDGSLDGSFAGPAFAAGDVYAVAIQPDGKILVGGNVLVSNSDRGIYRLNSDGSRDPGFNSSGAGIIGTVWALAVQPDGKILVGGDFDTYNGSFWHNIVRLNSDGSIDSSFAIGAGFSGAVFALALQTDGKILAGGRFTFFNGVHRNYIARLNQNGSLDTGFVPGPGFDGGFNGDVYSLAIQPDGKIVAGGQFTEFDDGLTYTRKFIARLDADGGLDTAFDPDEGFNNGVNALAVQPNGRVFTSGGFNGFISGGQLIPRNFIARLTANGSLGSFNDAGGFDSSIGAMALQPDGRLVVGGRFTSYDNTGRNYIARLMGYSGDIFPVTVNGQTGSPLVVSNPVDVSYGLDGVTPPVEIFLALNAPPVGIFMSFFPAQGSYAPLPPADWTQLTPWDVRYPGIDPASSLFRGNLPPGTYDLFLGFDSELDGYFSFYRGGVTTFYRRVTVTVQ